MPAISEKFTGEGLTFDDVLLMPAYSEVLPRDVDISTRFSRNIRLNIPIVTAAMDTVTDAVMAIAIAQEGGIGVLHKNMSIEDQANEVRKVKRAENGMILDPITLTEGALVADALAIMRDYGIGGIPVVDLSGKLIGIVTNRDLRFERNPRKPVAEVMTSQNLITTTEFTDFEKAADILQQYKIEKLPVVDKDFKLVGLITYKDIIKIKARPNACKDERGRLRVAAAVGVTSDMTERVQALVNNGVDAVVIDTAHGHSKGVMDATKLFRKRFPGVDLIVGNVGTAEAARDFRKLDIDGIKVGIGPGSICTTRVIAGIGIPQLSAIYQVASELKGSGIPVIADGGIRYTGDIPKAIAAGADCIMAGGLFAGVEESPGETIIYEGRKYKSYRGMGSMEAMQKGSKDRYFQDMEEDIKKLVPEGIAGRVPFKGTLSEVVHQLVGGLRAGMGYTGSENIARLQQARFIKITAAGVTESHPHDITITSEAPNYSR
ncbi:IMP dehydrogenase [Lentimicrobium sp.]|jgi:IMP dehydrogenase|uniref:IMP dehydrogenase n=1 Tax=Lentimicrobium sp. TaxID=2034841 RepID=UPI0025D2122D|nr:IMP dehydrogenase [Lentimicrobium sp.]MCO5256758.1 IMP dehydrogenase [Lentimicrobium sp.]HOP13927.1 IMP dehydrogenase [Lentimicrobium sp.]HPF63325.1 IMP dehydrogenase [Lentimicrobium sp.]HPJ62319.1 IMP dehydrogenase [Lentimicrobium sp.]HPR25474.1 IMP dehydrogenase [Lentimicrobium sp.]